MFQYAQGYRVQGVNRAGTDEVPSYVQYNTKYETILPRYFAIECFFPATLAEGELLDPSLYGVRWDADAGRYLSFKKFILGSTQFPSPTSEGSEGSVRWAYFFNGYKELHWDTRPYWMLVYGSTYDEFNTRWKLRLLNGGTNNGDQDDNDKILVDDRNVSWSFAVSTSVTSLTFTVTLEDDTTEDIVVTRAVGHTIINYEDVKRDFNTAGYTVLLGQTVSGTTTSFMLSQTDTVKNITTSTVTVTKTVRQPGTQWRYTYTSFASGNLPTNFAEFVVVFPDGTSTVITIDNGTVVTPSSIFDAFDAAGMILSFGLSNQGTSTYTLDLRFKPINPIVWMNIRTSKTATPTFGPVLGRLVTPIVGLWQTVPLLSPEPVAEFTDWPYDEQNSEGFDQSLRNHGEHTLDEAYGLEDQIVRVRRSVPHWPDSTLFFSVSGSGLTNSSPANNEDDTLRRQVPVVVKVSPYYP